MQVKFQSWLPFSFIWLCWLRTRIWRWSRAQGWVDAISRLFYSMSYQLPANWCLRVPSLGIFRTSYWVALGMLSCHQVVFTSNNPRYRKYPVFARADERTAPSRQCTWSTLWNLGFEKCLIVPQAISGIWQDWMAGVTSIQVQCQQN